ncbi:MAG: Poly [ADP-ribose] polymerase 1 [Sclerophora amabilis]|nr:MAG: Poly [ADP-ribose] polymerase 1 [Sclerophora amabilis]
MVISETDLANRSAKSKQAANIPTIYVVSLDWLLECLEQQQKLPEASYLMTRESQSNDTNVGRSDDTESAANGHDDAKSTNAKPNSKKHARSEPSRSKEAGEGTDAENEPRTKRVKDSQKAKANIKLPVDERCSLAGTHQIYIDDDKTIWDAALNQTNVGNNNNKFYRLQMLTDGEDFRTWTRWGRVGEPGQSAMLGNGDLATALTGFQKKFRDKTGLKWENRMDPPRKGKYTFVERDYEDSDTGGSDKENDGAKPQGSRPPMSQLPESVQRLMQLIFNKDLFDAALSDMRYDANKLPLGKLSKTTLRRGFAALKDLADVLANPGPAPSGDEESYNTAIARLTNAYYTVIPHSFGRDRPPLIGQHDRLKKEVEFLESLSDMNIANEIMTDAIYPKDSEGRAIHPLDCQYQALRLTEMTPLKSDSIEYQELSDYLLGSRGHTHHHDKFELQDIFRIERDGELERYQTSEFAKRPSSDKRLLWHGSRCQNFGGILSQGLRIAPPEAPSTGKMFGNGVYLADVSSKSAGYCASISSGNVGLLLLCVVELGAPMLEMTLADSNANATCSAAGMISTWGKGKTGPTQWKDASCVSPDLQGVKMPDFSKGLGPTPHHNAAALLYNEYIAYNVAQIRLKYLLRVLMK